MPNNKRKREGSSKGKGRNCGAGNAQDADGKPCSRLRV